MQFISAHVTVIIVECAQIPVPNINSGHGIINGAEQKVGNTWNT